MHRSTDITSNLQKNARTADVIAALRAWQEPEALDALAERIVRGNILGKATRARAADLTNRVLRRRFFPEGNAQPARHLHRLLCSNQPRAIGLLLMFYYTALAEHTLYRLVADVVFRQACDGESAIDGDIVVASLQRLRGADGGEAYSKETAKRIVRSSLTLMRDVGIIEGRTRKRLATFSPPQEVVGYIAYALRSEGASARRILEHEDWRLLLLTPRQVEQELIDASSRGWFSYSAAGDVRRLDWQFENLDAFIDAVT